MKKKNQYLLSRFIFGIEEWKNINCSKNDAEEELFKLGVACFGSLEQHPGGHDQPWKINEMKSL